MQSYRGLYFRNEVNYTMQIHKSNLQNPIFTSRSAKTKACVCEGSTPESPHTNASFGNPLGIYTNLRATPENKGLQRDSLKRAEKYALQNEVIKLLPKERVRGCLRYRISTDGGVDVRYNEKREKAHFSNVQRCGSVWVCPVCSAQISEGRRQELNNGMNNWTAQGGAVYLVTFTNPHHVGDNLQELLDGQKIALQKFWRQRKVRETMKALGYVGRIVATEVTYGKNGWHPHYHVLMFFEHHIDTKPLRNFIGIEWQIACSKAGLKKPSLEHGCDVRDGSFAQEYVSKWGLEDEMTKGHVKKGRTGSMTPWDLLRASMGGDEQAGRLFKAFAKAFKGKQQLAWSKGLKSLLAVDEVTDEELATETEKDSISITELDIQIWKIILTYKARADYLQCVESDIKTGADTATDFVMDLAERYIHDYPEVLQKFAETMELKNRVAELTEMSTD